MSLTADTADAIIAVDAAVAKYERMLDRLRFEVPEASDALADMAPEWAELKDAIVGLQETACGEGMHFDSADDARRYRDVTDHKYVTPADSRSISHQSGGCAFFYSGTFRCGKTFNQHR